MICNVKQNKICVIAHEFPKIKRGAFTTAKNLANIFQNITFIKEHKNLNLEELNKQYNLIILLTQAPSKYSFPVNIIRLKNINHVIFIRDEYNHPIFNSYTNGFYYYKQNPSIKNYAPILPKMPKIKMIEPKRPVLGYYVRKSMIPDAYWKFCNIVKNYKEEIDVCIMGNPAPELKNYKNVINYTHTYNNLKFFSKITKFIYPMSKVFIDPFPNSLYEAIQYKKELIIPTLYRNFKDGIDDILDCYYDDLSLLDWKNFKSFYLKLFETNFVYKFDKMCYMRFNEWIKGEIL